MVTLRKITLRRRCRSETLLVQGTFRLDMNTNRCAWFASMRLRSVRPGSPIGTAAMMGRAGDRGRRVLLQSAVLRRPSPSSDRDGGNNNRRNGVLNPVSPYSIA